MCEAWYIATNWIRYRHPSEPEFWQRCSGELLVFLKQSRQVCFVCVCVCACACARAHLRVRASALVRTFHKSAAVNIHRLKFLIVYNNTVIKSNT
jgi:hypothetical protein